MRLLFILVPAFLCAQVPIKTTGAGGSGGSGTVVSVNGITPDFTGDVILGAHDLLPAGLTSSDTLAWAKLDTFPYLPNYLDVSYSATPTFPLTNTPLNQVFHMTLTGSVTSSTLTGSPFNGQVVTWIICQDGSGNHDFVFPTSFVDMPGIEHQAGYCTKMTATYNGTAFEGTSLGYSTFPTPGICNSSNQCWDFPTTPQPLSVHNIDFFWNGGGSVVASGEVQSYFTATWYCTIYFASIDVKPSGSASVEVSKKANYAIPADGPTSADKISASAPVAVTTATSNNTVTGTQALTGWTTSVSPGDIFGAYISGVASATSVHVQLGCK